ncbi:DUF2878 domain-containing protein [Pseudomonadota bacterium]
MKIAVNFIAFQIGWFACILGASNGMPWIGLLVGSLVISFHLFSVDKPAKELNLILYAVVIGIVLDSLLVMSGWLSYPNGILLDGTAPYWILMLWALFASTLNVSMRWMHDKYWVAAIFGAVGGPLSYLAGARLGAVTFIELQPALLALALGWALAMPCLIRLSKQFDGVSIPTSRYNMEKVGV